MPQLHSSRFCRFAQIHSLSWLFLIGMGSICQRPPAAQAQDPEVSETELSEEESRQRKTAERFLEILEKNPRLGTAFERVYGHHVEFGTLDAFLKSLRTKADAGDATGATWMLLGMLEAQRGEDAAAVEALLKADQIRSQDPLASYYLAQAQLRIGQSAEAVASFERAIERKPARSDLLEISQMLGRVHQRAQRTEAALLVWQRLEAQFPDDPRVLEQIAVTLAEEGEPELALLRYLKLIELVQDDYRQVVYRVTAADLMIKSGERDRGIESLEQVLGDLNPESWMYKDVRRRIESVFMNAGDQDRLVQYYQNWLAKHPEDVEGMTRLARFLATAARVPEATQWMEKALKLAPSRTDLRKAFIDQLVNDQRISDALAQYEQLLASAPGNPDFLRDWGKLVMRNKEVPEAERQQEAVRIWNQILATRPDDALTVSQVADLYRQHKILPEAEKLYRKAIELAPNEPQYGEYLGEFLHLQQRSTEAIAIWEEIAAGSRRNAVNLSRLAEVFQSFGLPDRAIVEIAAAVKLDPKDFSLLIRAADYHAKAGKYDDSLAFVEAANKLAADEDERDRVIQQRIEVLQASQRLDSEADALFAQLREQTDATPEAWYLAARYLEVSRRLPEATEAIDQAMKLAPKSTTMRTLAARIAEAAGDYGRAAQMNRTLADMDRRARGDHLMNVSRLEAQLGRPDEALKAAQELILFAPGNTDHYEFYAQTCFRLGRPQEGLEALRKAVRINPNEPHLIMALGTALAEQLRTDEAIALYWRAFEKSEEVEDKVGLTMKLAPLYQQLNQFDKLVDRLEREQRDEEKRREMTVCLAQAWHTIGDLRAARRELEGLLSENTRDTNLLNQLAKLCQDDSDLEQAIDYQRQLVAIAPGHETEFPLAGMLAAQGRNDEARDIFAKLLQREEDPVRQMKGIDSLITQGNFESALAVIEPLRLQNPGDWELLYREGVVWASLDKSAEAVHRFERILAQSIPYDSLSRSAAEQRKQDQAKEKSNNLRGIATAPALKMSPLAMSNLATQVQLATGLIADNRYIGSSRTPAIWIPESYGLARMAAFGWLLRFEEAAKGAKKSDSDVLPASAEAKPSIAERVRAKAAEDNAPRDAVYDWLFVARLTDNLSEHFEVARRLAEAGGQEERRFFLAASTQRHLGLDSAASIGGSKLTSGTPLNDDDLQLLRDCYREVKDADDKFDLAAVYGGHIAFASNGQAYQLIGGGYVALPGVFQHGNTFLNTIVNELKLAGKVDEATALLNDHVAKAVTPADLVAVLELLFNEQRHEEMFPAFERWQQAALQSIASSPPASSHQASAQTHPNTSASKELDAAMNILQKWLGDLGAKEETALVLKILDRVLTVAEAEVGQRRKADKTSQTQRASVSRSVPAMNQVAFYQGNSLSYQTTNFPLITNWMDRTSYTLLYQVVESFKRNDITSDLSARLRERLQEIPEDSEQDDRKIFMNLCLAAVLWWSDEQDDAVERMASVASLTPEDVAMQFSLASMHQNRNEIEEALEVIDQINPLNQQVLLRRELEALALAERLGDHDRAREAAERLFGLRMDAQTQLSLVERMRRLGLSEMADAVLSRTARSATNQVSSLASMMNLYQGQGDTEQANQLAHMLLRKTPSPIDITLRSGRNPSRYRTQDSTARTQAIDVLKRSGGLKILIEQLESQLERAPDSIPPLQQLIEFYGVTGQKEESLKKLQAAVDIRPNAPVLRLQLAKHYSYLNQANEACDQYLALLKLQPAWVIEELSQIDSLFARANRKDDLVKAVTEVNLKQIQDPYAIVNMANNLIRNPSTLETGITLLERTFDALPASRQNLHHALLSPSVWKSDRIYPLAKRLLLPTAQQIRANPWVGLHEVRSFNSNGEVNVFIHQMLKGITASDKLPDLEASIQELVTQQPRWHSGQIFLALLELTVQRKQEAMNRLKTLVADETIVKSMPSEASWIVGQELDRFEETRDLAMHLFEDSLAKRQGSSTPQMRYSPTGKLVDAYLRTGQSDKARQMLLKQVSLQRFDHYDPAYATQLRMENNVWAAERLMKFNASVDAVRLYQEILEMSDRPEVLANLQNGGQPDRYQSIALRGIAAAIASVKDRNASEVVEQLLVVSDSTKADSPALALMISLPDPKAMTSTPMKSSWLEMLQSIAADTTIKEQIALKFEAIAAEHPQDLSLAIAATVWHLNSKNKNSGGTSSQDKNAENWLKKLVELANDRSLEAIPEGRRPNTRQRREAAAMVPLWLAARECIAAPDFVDEGTQLAELALAAAKRQPTIRESSAILFEWGTLLLKSGRREEAEARWSQLLELATERPVARQTNTRPQARLWRPNRKPLPSTAMAAFAGTPLNAAATMVLMHPVAQVDAVQGTEAKSTSERTDDSQQKESSSDKAAKASEKKQAKNIEVAANDATPKATPPLSMTQFRTAMAVARAAAENGMPELSRRATRESLMGGFPVPDPIQQDQNSLSRTMISGGVSTFSRTSAQATADPLDAEVVSTLKDVLKLWTGDQYAPDDTYRLMKALVLPENRPQEIRVYFSRVDVSEMDLECLAESMIAAAEKSNHLDDLRHALASRRTNAAAASALEILIEIHQEKTEAASEKLELLAKSFPGLASNNDREMAFLAALRAFEIPKLRKAAFPILRQMTHRQLRSSSGQSQNAKLSGRLASAVNKYLAEAGDDGSLKEYFDSLQLNRQEFYRRMDPSAALSWQKNDWNNMALQAAELNAHALALEYLGRAYDVTIPTGSFHDPLSLSLGATIRQLRGLPPMERYQAWYDWTMPKQGRQTLRVLHETTTPLFVPPVFMTTKSPEKLQLQDRILSNFSELVESAKLAGKLTDLCAAVKPLAESKTPSADILLTLILIAQDDVAAAVPQVQALQNSFAVRVKSESPESQLKPSAMGDYLVYKACLESPTFVHLFETHLPRFRKQLQDASQHSLAELVNRDWADRASAIPFAQTFVAEGPLTNWIPVNGSENSGSNRPWWTTHEKQWVHLCGNGESNLFFRYPLTGNFTISIDCLEDHWTECNASFGGARVFSQNWSSMTMIRSLSGHESFSIPVAMKRSRPAFNRVSIEVRDGNVKHLLNNHRVYQEPVATTSPWFLLHTEGHRMGGYKNLQIQGDITIPSKVSLIAGDKMDGWNCDGFAESQPRKRLMKQNPQDFDSAVAYDQRREPPLFDWSASENVLKGRAVETASSDQQSWLYYQRPLLDGELIQYQFYYAPGVQVAHPAIGRIAFLLEPDGVRSHWIANTWSQVVHSIAPTNAVEEVSVRRGPDRLPLKPNDWNQVELALQDNQVIVTLNGTVVCKRAIEPELSRRFGLFRFKRQALQVRNLELHGNWPQRLPPAEELYQRKQKVTPELTLTTATILNDLVTSKSASEVVRTARAMPADAALEYLADWVLPSATHANIRLYVSSKVASAADPMPDNRSEEHETEGLDCPAISLLRVAAQLGKLDPLASRINQVEALTESEQRKKHALQTLVALELGLRQAVASHLKQVWLGVEKPYPQQTPAEARLADFIVAWQTGLHTKHWASGYAIARKLRDYERDSGQASHSPSFRRQVHTLVGDIERFARAMSPGKRLEVDPQLAQDKPSPQATSQWVAVPYLSPAHRASGYRPSTWAIAPGVAQHLPADTWSQLFFQSPLRGKFEIQATRTTHGHKEVSVAWGMHSVEPRHDLKALRVTKVMHLSSEIEQKVDLTHWEQQADFRMLVDGRKLTTFVNGVQIHQQNFETDPDPWLMLQTREPGNYGRVSNVRILGTPEIPTEIDLINIAGLASWRADMYGEWIRTETSSDTSDSVPWRRYDDELYGHLAEKLGSEYRESLILYQRPMLEDGVIEFDSWYDPGVFEVHPAVGRTALMLTPEGVRLHRLTDAQYERNDLQPNNQESIPDAAPKLSLKPKDWNQIRLTLKGDQLTIHVNGIDAATVQIKDPANERQFGLFRYSNKTECRVRKLVYRGQWPKTLPELNEQQLAFNARPDSWADADVSLDADLARPVNELQEMKLELRGPTSRWQTSPEGLQLHLHNTKVWTDSPSITSLQPLRKDCELTVCYKDLRISPHKTGWGVSLIFEVILDDPQNTRVECNIQLDRKQQIQYKTQMFRLNPVGGNLTFDAQDYRPATTSGKLRIVRRGGEITCYAAAEDSEEFVQLNSFAIGNSTIKQWQCAAKCSDAVGKVDVTLTRMTIREASH